MHGADGTAIFTETWLPKAKDGDVPPARLPTVLEYSPYLEQGSPGSTGHRRALEHLVTRGYAFTTAHVRGTGASEGCVDPGSPHEADDGARVVEYIGRDSPWSNGRVGMYGLSYPGGTQAAVAALGDSIRTRYLKAIVPVAPAVDWYDGYYQDGVAWFLVGPASQAFTYFLQSSLLVDPTGAVQEIPVKLACQPAVMSALLDSSGNKSAYWQEHDSRRGVANIRAATLVSQGHLDDRVPSFILSGFFDRLPATTPKAGIFGPWNHEFPDVHTFGTKPAEPDWERKDWLEMVTAWFDRYLKGLDSGVDTWPVAQVQGTDGQWRGEPEWPLPGGPVGQLALGPRGTLGAIAPRGATSYSESAIETTGGTYPPGTAAVFETAPLTDRLELTGTPVLDAWLSLDQNDAHVAAKLEVVDREGRLTTPESRAVGLRSAQHRDPLVAGRFVQERGTPAPIGTPFRLPLRFNATSLVVPKGGRLRLTVAGSVIVDDGLDGVKTGAGVIVEGPSQPSGSFTRVSVLHDCSHPSTLRFLVPRPRPDLLNVREKDEPPTSLLADNSADRAPVSDGGGIAHEPICGRPPVRHELLGESVAYPPRLRLSVTPRRARAGRRTRFRFRATALLRHGRRPMPGTAIDLAGRRASTDARGRTSIIVALPRRGRYRARATRPGFGTASAAVLSRRRR